MKNVEQAEEELVPGTHHEQNRLQEERAQFVHMHKSNTHQPRCSHISPDLGGVVDPQDRVPREVDSLVTR